MQARDCSQQRRLTRPIGADHCEYLALIQAETHVVNRF